jgi:predicted transcriptional regulator
MPMPAASFDLRPDLADGLRELAAETGRSPAELAEEAVAGYLDYERWKAGHIRSGLAEAEAGDFASDEEAEAVFSRYKEAAGRAER